MDRDRATAKACTSFHSWDRTPAVSGTTEGVAQALDASAWRRLSAGPGTKGTQLHDWAYLDLAGFQVQQGAEQRNRQYVAPT